MSSTDRQNNLLISEDWKKIYQSFKNADFQSYDFDNLRRTMIDYIRTNFPEDFNDYIESSEYLALIDLIAYVGQSIAFRVDINARENFLELAERRDSVLRLARMISYNASRNKAASGLLKFNTISTTESVLDSNGRNLAGQYITWNDTSNPTWYDQFIKIINAALPTTQQYGNPADSGTIYGVSTAQYRFNGTNTDVPVYSFTKSVAGKNMNFEITSTTFSGKTFIYEEPPKIGNSIACIYKDDGYGSGSTGTGFFFNFTQGTLSTGSFSISQPSSNQTVDVATQNINNSDVWLYSLDQNGLENDQWTQVPSTVGNNIIYNSLNSNIKNIYSVITRATDAISLSFSDGIFGNLPLGNFRVYYRASNSLIYTINPTDIRNISIAIPYKSAQGSNEILTISLNLPTTVSNSTPTETNASIKANAPQTYYTQNRMITGEDYNISPLSATTQVAKVKAINRTSSGISRYFDLIDPTGKYSSTNLFANDGVAYRENFTTDINFSYITETDIESVIYGDIYNILNSPNLRNFYYANYINFLTASLDIIWYNVTTDSNSSTGYVGGVAGTTSTQPYKVGSSTATDLKYLTPGSLIKFTVANPTTQYFDTLNDNAIVTPSNGNINVTGASSYIWAEVVNVNDDGTAGGTGVLSTGFGPVILNQVIPTNAVLSQILPVLTRTLDSSVITTMIDLIFSNQKFGLRYGYNTKIGIMSWQIIFETNLNVADKFNLGNQGDTTNLQKDASWLLLFDTNNEYYTVTSRQLRYVFESDKQVNFYFDTNTKIYDTVSTSIVKDSITILDVNTQPNNTLPFTNNLYWDVVGEYNGLDGYVDSKKIVISFADSDNNGIVDNPQLFIDIVDPTTSPLTKFIVQQKYLISQGQEDYKYVANDSVNGLVIILNTESAVGSLTQYSDGQYFYFIDIDVVKKLDLSSGILNPTLDYKVYVGRDNLRFQYKHGADYDSRIDPGASNIIDIYVLTTSYDIQFRQWLLGANTSEPLPPSSSELNSLLSPNLNLIKSISDQIIYHPVKYKLLFGSTADINLQASFNVMINPNSTVSSSNITARILTAINQFFALENWDFGDTFYFTELSTYIMSQVSPDITNFVIVPKQAGQYFGSLFEIKCPSDQIFVSCASATDIVVVSGLTSGNLKTVTGQALTDVTLTQTITSATNGATNG
jgi:hypothetical protein